MFFHIVHTAIHRRCEQIGWTARLKDRRLTRHFLPGYDLTIPVKDRRLRQAWQRLVQALHHKIRTSGDRSGRKALVKAQVCPVRLIYQKCRPMRMADIRD